MPSYPPRCTTYNSQEMERAYKLISNWMDTEDVARVCMYVSVCASTHTWHTTTQPLEKKKRWNLAIYDNMDGPWGYHAKLNKSDGDDFYVTSIL